MFSGQQSGFFIRYPDFKSSNKVSTGMPGYGDPPRKEHLKDINEYCDYYPLKTCKWYFPAKEKGLLILWEMFLLFFPRQHKMPLTYQK